MNDLVNGSLFERHFDDLERRQAARQSTALILGTDTPDRAAEGVQLGSELSVPPQAVMGAPEVFRGQAETLRATTALRSAPNLADWLGDPVNGALGKDDLDNLTWFELNFGAGGRAIGRGVRRLSAVPDYFGALADSTRAGDVGKTYDEILAEEVARWGEGVTFDMLPAQARVNALQVAELRYDAIAGQGEAEQIAYIRRGAERLASAQEILRITQNIPMSESATMFRDGRLANAENTLMGTLSAFVDDPIGGAAFIAETAAETLPVLAGATATTAATRSPTAGVAVMAGGSFLMENTNSAMQFLQERGVDMSTPEAAALVLQNRELMAEAQKLGVERGLIIAMFDAVSGGVAGKALLENPAGDMVVQGIAQAALGAGGEATAQLATEGEIDWREVVIEGLAELATAPIEVVGVGGRGMLDMLSRFSRSGETSAAIAEIDAVAAESKVRVRSVDKFLEALQASNMDDKALYVSAEGLQEYFQAKDTPLDDETLRAWGVDPSDFAEKLTSGGDVTVPVANYAARISGTDDALWFRENSVLDPGEMSVAEAAEFNDRVRDIMAEEFDRRAAELEGGRLSRASDVQIYDDVFSQLRSAGRSPDVAQQEATVWASFWRAMSERYGEDALDLARSMGVAIQGPQTPEVARRRDQLDIMLNTLRSQGERALAPRGPGILDFVRDQGGVRDRGGDVESLDVPRGVIAETAAEVRERESQPRLGGGVDLGGKGRGLDDLGRAMIEAGYFPEYMGGANTNSDGTVVDEAAIALEAISEAVAGRERYVEGDGPDQDLADLAAALSELGIDLSASNDEIVAALQEAGEGQVYNQGVGASQIEQDGVSVSLSETDDRITLHRIVADERGQGAGSAYMQKLTDYADRNQKQIALTPSKDFGGSVSRLRKFYKGFGFVENKGRNKDFTTQESMIREPQPVEMSQEKRGSIVLPRGGLTEGQTVINLFESADLSTFLHESGHFFLEAFTALATSEGAPQAMRDDLSVIHKFLEVEDGAALTRDQHETWARGFEAYLMEGKAPSLRLASAFARFKAWLTRIYRTVRNLNVKLTPEVREVMDRMLATDEEIAATRDDLAMRPLFTDAAPAGMSDADFATYQRMAQRSADQAEASLMKRTMEKVRRETQRWFKDEKAAVRAEVEASANKMPVYRLTEMLANQRWIGDADRDVPNVQMDRDALVDQFGEGVIAELGRTRLGGKRAIYAKGGERPELVAEMFGFANVVEMVEALQNAGKRKDYIDGETDRIMVERHGDPLNDGSIEEAAALAVHSEQQAAMVTTEARAIAKRLGLPTRNIKAKEYRARAKAMVGRMSVREASRSASFLQAERRAAKAAERAFARVARGGTRAEASLAEAMQAKEQQILNHFLYQEARDFEARLQRAREKFRSFQKESVRKAVGLAYLDEATGEMVPGHIEQIDALLERYDFRSRSQKQVRNAESLMAYVQRMTDEGRADELAIDPVILRDAERRHYTRLSVDEFAGLVDTVANIEHMGRRRARLVDRKRKRDLNEVASRVSGLVRDRFGRGKSDAQSGAVRNFFNLLMRVDTVAIDIDKAEMGDFYDAIKRPIDEGSAAEQQMNAESAVEIEALFDVYTSKEKRDFNKVRVIPSANGQPWSKQQILSVALNTGNKENLQRVLDRRVDRSVRLTQPQLDALLDTLDKRDWDFVQSIWDFVGKFQKESFDVAERMTGVRPKAVEAAAVQTRFGTYRGGYYPIGYDPTKSKAAQLDAEGALDQFLSAGRGNAAKVADGFTKGRAQSGGGRAVLYDFSVMMRHSVDAARLIALAEPVYNAQRILNHRSVSDAFRDGGQANLLSQLNLFLQDIAAGPMYSSDPINAASRFMKNNFTLSRLAFNLKTVALQVTGLGQSAAVIGKRNLMRGFNVYRRNPARVAQEVLAKSAFMAERQTTFQKDVFDAHNEARVSSPIASRWRAGTEVLSKAGFAPMVKTQFYVVDLPTWLGAFEAEIRRNGGDEAKAIHFADRMVDRSQGGGFMADRNALERGTVSRNVRQSDFVRLWTTLGGYMVTKLNRGYVTTRQGARAIGQAKGPIEKAAQAANMATDLTLLFVFEAALMGLAYSLLTDDEEEEDVAAFIAKETAAAALGGIPFVRESFSAFSGYGAGGVLSSALEIPADVWAQISQGENDKSFRRAIADAIGFGTGLPTTQSIRVIEEIIAGDDGSIAEAAFGRNPLAE